MLQLGQSHDIGDGDAQGAGNAMDVADRNILLAAFNGTNIGAMNT